MKQTEVSSLTAINCFEAIMEHRYERKVRRNWYININDIITGVTIYGDRFNVKAGLGQTFLEFGCFIRELNKETWSKSYLPPVIDFHLRIRLEDIISVDDKSKLDCFNDNAPMKPDERISAMERMYTMNCEPILAQLNNKESIVNLSRKKVVRSHVFSKWDPIASWIET